MEQISRKETELSTIIGFGVAREKFCHLATDERYSDPCLAAYVVVQFAHARLECWN